MITTSSHRCLVSVLSVCVVQPSPTAHREVNRSEEEACNAEITQNPEVLHLPAGTMKQSENNILFH